MSELKLQQCRLDGRYDITECLGRGSYAEIYVANDLAAARKGTIPSTIVIKALNLYLQGAPDAELERTLTENFQNEAIALDRVRHPNVINRLGHGTALDLAGRAFHYIVLEYMPGGDLAAYCRQRPLSLERTLYYLQQICAGLSHAHSRGIIHRDIKPQNLLLSADLQIVKIADFGVAKLEASDEPITRVGTDVYSAPEHNPLIRTGPLDTGPLNGHRQKLGPPADIYSLAKTVYMLLTGESPRRFAQRQITELPPSLSNHYWSAGVLNALRTATEQRIDLRYQTAGEFLEEMMEATLAPTVALGEQVRTISTVTQSSAEAQSMEAAVIAQRPAPVAPDFPPTQQLKELPVAEHARIVVPLSETSYESALAQQKQNEKPVQQKKIKQQAGPAVRPATRRPGRLLRGALVPAILILCLSGVLLATHAYFSRRHQQTTDQTDTPSDIGREALARTDINLRPEPNLNNQRIGVVEENSRVRIIGVRGNWMQVQILQHGREGYDPSSADRGWVDQRFLDKK